MHVRRLSILAALCCLSCAAFAERLILIPVGKKVPYKAVRVSSQWQLGQHDQTFSTLGLGIGEAFDMTVVYEDSPGFRDKSSLDFSYNVSDPIVGIGPGVSVGVLDALDKTSDRRAYYFAATFAEGMLGEFNQGTPSESTIGVRFDDRGFRAFAGGTFPFTDSVIFVAEHDSRRFTAGLEFRPIPGGRVRLLGRSDNRTMMEASYLLRF